MTIINISENSSKTQIIYEKAEYKHKQFEYIIQDGFLYRVRIFYPNGDLKNEVLLNDGKINCFITYNKKSISYESEVEGCIIRPDNENLLNLYEKFSSEKYYLDENISYLQNLSFIEQFSPQKSLANTASVQYRIESDELGNKLYEGFWLDDKKTEHGTLFYTNGNIKYNGLFKNDEYHGHGSLFHENGNTWYKGNWNQGDMDGDVQLYYENGNLEYFGTLSNGVRKGYGTAYYENGNKTYEGFWEDGQYCGEGKSYDAEEILYMKGKFNKGTFEGIEYNRNGTRYYEGSMEFYNQNWVPDGNGIQYYENGNIAKEG